MSHHWGPPQHRRNRFSGDRPITAWECLVCGTALLVDGWRAEMPRHWQARQTPCPPKPRCPHRNSIDLEARDEGLSTVTERECLDCGCMYSAIRRKQSEWMPLPAPPKEEE